MVNRTVNIGLVFLLVFSGCVKRTLIIYSVPPGATVFLDNQEIGITPTRYHFNHYGTREVKLRKDGFQPLIDSIKIDPPFYEWPVLNFFSELIIPVTLEDKRVFHYRLEPYKTPSPEKVLERANELRQQMNKKSEK